MLPSMISAIKSTWELSDDKYKMVLEGKKNNSFIVEATLKEWLVLELRSSLSWRKNIRYILSLTICFESSLHQLYILYNSTQNYK